MGKERSKKGRKKEVNGRKERKDEGRIKGSVGQRRRNKCKKE